VLRLAPASAVVAFGSTSTAREVGPHRRLRPTQSMGKWDNIEFEDDDKPKTTGFEKDPQLQKILEQCPGAEIIRPDDPDASDRIRRRQEMPQEDPKDVQMQLAGLTEVRMEMSLADRLEKAEETKAQANEHFGNGKWKVAMKGYVAAIWFLKRGNPKCPTMVASDHLGLEQVPTSLGAGTAATGEAADAPEPEGFLPLRITCHLNLAQSAIKMGEWNIAKVACEYVLSVDAANVKALFRIAKAQEGEGQPKSASASLTRLLKVEPNNADARKALEAIKKRSEKEKKAFAGVFSRAQGDNTKGDGLYTAAEESRDKAEEEVNAKTLPPMPQGPTKDSSMVTGDMLKHMTEKQREEFVRRINEDLDTYG